MYCPQCGLDVGERASFCRRCGTDLRETRATEPLEPLEPAEPQGPTGSLGPVWPPPASAARSRPTSWDRRAETAGSASPPNPPPAPAAVPLATETIAQRPGGRLLVTPRGELPLAGFGIRLGGLLIDLVFYFAVSIVLAVIVLAAEPEAPDETLTLVSWLVALGGEWLFNSIGWSPGKRAVGLRIVVADGRAPGAGKGLGRTVAAWISGLAFGLGYLWAAWDRKSQTWHDKMAETYVVRVS